MAIEMTPGEFPEQCRGDPKRNAEARVYDALNALELDGHGIYEFRYRLGGRQLDFVLWLDGIGHFAMQVRAASTGRTPPASGACGRWTAA